MFFRRAQLRRAQRLLQSGELDAAAALALQSRLPEYAAARSFCAELTEAIFQHVRRRVAERDLAAAWQSLNLASRIGNHFDPRRVVQARQALLEQTLQSADFWLHQENLAAAQGALEHLSRQHILDSRADQMLWLIGKIAESERKADAGQWKQAVQMLEEAVVRRPDLPWLAARAGRLRTKMERAGDLANRLQNALLRSNWGDVKQVSRELLGLSPHYPIAADALRRCQQADSRPPRTPGNASVPMAVTASPVDRGSAEIPPGEKEPSEKRPLDAQASSASGLTTSRRFMWWLDGVGGYLACTGTEWLLGRAVPDAAIEIPIQGDLRRRHAKLQRRGTDYVLTPLAETRIEGRSIDRPTHLKHGHTIELGDHVRIRFLQPHPFSATAKLEVVSRHRTYPWADAVLLVAETVVVGARGNSHIVAPGLDQPVVITFAADSWQCRQAGTVLVAGQPWPPGASLPTDAMVTIEGLSMTLETMGREKLYA